MGIFLLCHRHTVTECGPTFAAWKGFDSPLRDQIALCSCLSGGHQLWWIVDATSADVALGQLPAYIAERTAAIAVRATVIP